MGNKITVGVSVLALVISAAAFWGQTQSAERTDDREKHAAQINACVALSAHHYQWGNREGGPWADKARSLAICLSDDDPTQCRAQVNQSDAQDLC